MLSSLMHLRLLMVDGLFFFLIVRRAFSGVGDVESVFPTNPHGYCLRHLEENFHKVFKNSDLKMLLWKAARAMDQDTALSDMATIDPKSVPWLLEHADPKHWAELSFDGEHYGHLTSNIAESLNAWLLKA